MNLPGIGRIRIQLKSIFKIYNSASTVASLWVVSMMLPALILAKEEIPFWVKSSGLVVFVIIGFSLTQYRSYKISIGSWAFSDFVAYILVPIILFSFVTFMIYVGT